MNKSESIVKIAPALLKAQRLIEGAIKGADNPYFKSKYASLNNVIDACKQHLNDNGIVVLQPVFSDSSGDYVETTLLHESGEFITSCMRLVLSKNDMQAYGSAVSYARRYALQSMAFMGAFDDDFESGMERTQAKQQTKQPVSNLVKDLSDNLVITQKPIEAKITQEPLKKVSSFRKPTKAAAVEAMPATTSDQGEWS